MDNKCITIESIEEYVRFLQKEEKSRATIQQYQREVQRFYLWLPTEKCVEKELAIRYKEELQGKKRQPASMPCWPHLIAFFVFWNGRILS